MKRHGELAGAIIYEHQSTLHRPFLYYVRWPGYLQLHHGTKKNAPGPAIVPEYCLV